MNTNKPKYLHSFGLVKLLVILAMTVSLSACDSKKKANSSSSSAANRLEERLEEETSDPSNTKVSILQGQVDSERERRSEAETKASTETSKREFWETLSVFAFILAITLFLIGTAIGSKGRQHAESL